MKNIYRSLILGIVALTLLSLVVVADPPSITQVYAVDVEVQGQGTVAVSPAPGSGESSFPANAKVFYYDFNSQGIDLQWTATPASGWTLDYWELGATGATIQSTDNPVTLSLSPGTANPSDWTVRAVFTEVSSYIVSVSASPTAGGAVTGGGTFVDGTSVTVTAVPSTSFTFGNWTEGGTIVSTSPSYTFTAMADRTLVANFTGGSASSYIITASANPSAAGTVTGSGTYGYGVSAVLTAQANTGYTFANWMESGTIVSTDASYTFTVTADRTLTANFTSSSGSTYSIAANAAPAAGGTVTGAGSYTQGALVTLTAAANAGYTFASWTETGAVVSTSSSYTFTATVNRTLVANFTGGSGSAYTIIVSANPIAGGAVTGGGAYAQGASATVTATANASYTFANWMEGGTIVSTSLSYTFTATANRTLVATFTQRTTTAIDDDAESGPDDWVASPLWHITDTKSSSPTHSWWFGDERTGTYASGEYGTQSVKSRASGNSIKPMAATGRVYGSLTSASLSLSEYGRQARVSFRYWRSVESYLDASYDKTYVQVQFGGGWQTIWSRSSQDPSKKTWEEVGLLVDVPSGATQMQVRFVFDSVDGLHNDYAGWFVDDVKVGTSEQGTVVVVPPLTNGTVGETYGPVQVTAHGGVAPYTWSWTGAVPGLSLDERSGAITGTPTAAGEYSVTLIATDAAGSTGTATCTIHISATTTSCILLTEDFTDPTGWTMTSLWHKALGLGCLTYASLVDDYAYFGKTSGCSYDTGSAVKGDLHSPAVDIPSEVQNVVIEFDEFRHVEGYSQAYDKTWVEVSFDNATWETIWNRNASYMSPEAAHVQLTRAVPAGATQMWIRFRFDSVDSYYNNYPGWAIDNVQILNGACVGNAPTSAMALNVPPAPARRDLVSVSNWPNPVTDVHTTTFTVRGANVEVMRIQIFDLSGTLVYEEEVPGNQLQWHTDNNYGEYLANGVYLYRALVEVAGRWITTPVRSLVILR